MLENESIEPRMLGYDRPSPKLLNFLSKYYNLNDYIEQNNNYVIFNDYFDYPNDTNKSNKIITKIQQKENSPFTTPNKSNYILSKTNQDELNYIFDKIDLNSNVPSFNRKNRKSSLTFDSDNIYNLEGNFDENKTKNSNNKSNMGNSKTNSEKKDEIKVRNINLNKTPPWATSDDSIKFSATSSSYGAYYAIKK